MLDIMEKISKFLNSNFSPLALRIKNNAKNLKLEPIDILSIEVSALEKLQLIINYFNKFLSPY